MSSLRSIRRTILSTAVAMTLAAGLAGPAPSAWAAAGPAAPTGLSVVTGDKAARVTWTAPLDDGGSVITGYTATAAPGGRTCSTAGALTCRIEGLTNGKSYTFTVVATNADGSSPPSAPTEPITVSYAPGGANAAVAVNANAQCINGEPVLAVYLLNKESVGIDADVSTTLGDVSVTGLAAGTAKYLTFPAASISVPDGLATITAHKTVDTTVYSTGYDRIHRGRLHGAAGRAGNRLRSAARPDPG